MTLPRKHPWRLLLSSLALAVSVFVATPVARAQANTPLAMHEGVGVDEKAGETVDLDLTFINETGQKVPLRRYFSEGKPVLLNLVYYRCPMLCNLVLNGQTETMRKIPWEPGTDYTVLTISIDPTETYAEFHRDDLSTGEIIVIGTDGIWESRNHRGEHFGKDALRQAIRDSAAGSAEQICQSITDALERFRESEAQNDDVTLVVVKLL
ncbi:MAG: SpoIIE family protein phosphatase [Bryobacterales bacterium]|nr:SpoIIE family protein phosphatase [Bryobacterales bacterium]